VLNALLTECNISRAAEKIYLSQSATSSALARLRDYFGDELLVSSGRQLVLTPRAKELVEPVREVLMRIDSTIATQPQFDPATETRTFTILVSDYTMAVLVPPLLETLYRQAPGVRVSLRHQYDRQPADVLEQGDADFLDESQFMNPGEAGSKPARKFSLRSRSIYMVGSALLGAIALGGALAFAYKQSGGAMGGGEPPVVQADSRPVKEAPQQPGGKEFPHKNKLIYERLQNGDQPEAERIVPRQEELAMPAMPGAAPAAAPGAAPMQPPAVAAVDDPNAADGGPRRVKTLVVPPDGSVMPPPEIPKQCARFSAGNWMRRATIISSPGLPLAI